MVLSLSLSCEASPNCWAIEYEFAAGLSNGAASGSAIVEFLDGEARAVTWVRQSQLRAGSWSNIEHLPDKIAYRPLVINHQCV